GTHRGQAFLPTTVGGKTLTHPGSTGGGQVSSTPRQYAWLVNRTARFACAVSVAGPVHSPTVRMRAPLVDSRRAAQVGGAVRCDAGAAGQEPPGVVARHDAVAAQA